MIGSQCAGLSACLSQKALCRRLAQVPGTALGQSRHGFQSWPQMSCVKVVIRRSV